MGWGRTLEAAFGNAARVRSPLRTEPSPIIRDLALELSAGWLEPRERAAAVFRFVRDEIRYGFTPAFDFATPEETLRFGRGHCNPQSVLFAALLRALGIPARSQFVLIDGAILDGLFPAGGPKRLAHAFTEVKIGPDWQRVDAYCVDPPLFVAAKRRLAELGRRMGCAVHADGVSEWDGTGHAMAQLVDPSMVLEDLGCFVDPVPLYRSAAYANRFSGWAEPLYRWFGAEGANRRLDALRRLGG